MDMIGSLLKSSSADDIAADFVAFVADKQSEDVLKTFVLDEALPHTHIAVDGIEKAIAWLSKTERSPKLLLIDLQGSDMPLSDLARLADVCEPSVQVIALGERNDVGLYRSLLSIGVHDYLVKPLTVGLLKRTIDMRSGKVNPVAQVRAGKIVAFAGARGGVGPTTVAVHLARDLAASHRRVAYVDLNLHGGAATSMFGLQGNNGLLDVLQNVRRLDPAYVERTMLAAQDSRLFVLSAELDWGEPRPFEEGSLGRVLDLLVASFHYVMLDIGELADPLAEEALDHAARAYIVADRSVHAARETVRLTRYIDNRSGNPITAVLLNNPNAVVAGKVESPDFVAAIGRPVLQELPFESRALAIAENVGIALPKGRGDAFHQAIARVANDLTGNQVHAERRSLWQRLGFAK